MHSLLKLGRSKRLDEVIDLLKPMPGHRLRLLNFVEEERARAQVAVADAVYAAPPRPRVFKLAAFRPAPCVYLLPSVRLPNA